MPNPHPKTVTGKVCITCKQFKLYGEFARGSNKQLKSYCKSCHAIREIEGYHRRKHQRVHTVDTLPESKCCATCKIVKSADDFHKSLTTAKGLASSCKSCCKMLRLKRLYGVTELKDACEVCFREPPDVVLVGDHCHTTEDFRGTLCSHCNFALGLLQDSPERILALHEYLTKWRA